MDKKKPGTICNNCKKNDCQASPNRQEYAIGDGLTAWQYRCNCAICLCNETWYTSLCGKKRRKEQWQMKKVLKELASTSMPSAHSSESNETTSGTSALAIYGKRAQCKINNDHEVDNHLWDESPKDHPIQEFRCTVCKNEIWYVCGLCKDWRVRKKDKYMIPKHVNDDHPPLKTDTISGQKRKATDISIDQGHEQVDALSEILEMRRNMEKSKQ